MSRSKLAPGARSKLRRRIERERRLKENNENEKYLETFRAWPKKHQKTIIIDNSPKKDRFELLDLDGSVSTNMIIEPEQSDENIETSKRFELLELE